jgi:DNA-binding CsgD family transcriptional regulator
MLSAKSRRLYRRLLELGPVPDADTSADVDSDALAELLEYGLVRETGDLLSALPPRTARGQVAMLANQHAQEVLRDAVEAEEFLSSCLTRAEHVAGDESPVEIIVDRSEIALLSATLQRRAQREVLSAQTSRFPEAYEGSLRLVGPIDTDIAAGIRYRVIYADELLKSDDRRDDIREGVGRGEEARIHPKLTLKFKVIDRSTALVPLDETAEAGALLIRSTPLCGLFVDYFEKLWAESATVGEISRDGARALNAIDMRVLAMLADDASDAAIARRLGLSERSVRRHVSALLTTFGVQTRTGIIAAAAREGRLS